MQLNCPQEVARYVGATLREALRDPEVASDLRGLPVRVRLGVVDPDCVLMLDVRGHEVREGRDVDVADGVIAMTAATAMDYLLGRIDLDEAVSQGVVVADGAGMPLLRMLHGGARLAAHCAEVLANEGRRDLLAATA